MSRYLIIDLEYSTNKAVKDQILEDMLSKPWVLSEAETLIKFKEIFMLGVSSEWNEYFINGEPDRQFEQIMEEKL